MEQQTAVCYFCCVKCHNSSGVMSYMTSSTHAKPPDEKFLMLDLALGWGLNSLNWESMIQ